MNILIASMEISFQVTISKSKVQITSNHFFFGVDLVNYGYKLFSGCDGPICALKKKKIIGI